MNIDNDLTTLVGANGSGKTTLLMAISKVFGDIQDQRTIVRSDFHLPPDADRRSLIELNLFIEIMIRFPELEQNSRSFDAIPAIFRHLIISNPGAPPFCRVRLEAKWTADGTADGVIDQDIFWIQTIADSPSDEEKIKMKNQERGLIQAYYIPASRNPSTQLKYTTKAQMGRLLRAIEWANEIVDKVQGASVSIQRLFEDEPHISLINSYVQNIWQKLNDDQFSAKAKLRFSGSQFENILHELSVTFQSKDFSQQTELENLSEGQQSLFYLSITAAISDLERKITGLRHSQNRSSDTTESGTATEVSDEERASDFQLETLKIPSFSIYLIEEPENHLAPHLLARVLDILRSIAESEDAQVLLSSHSPIILSRVEPDEVRHFRLDPSTRASIVKKLDLPMDPEDAAKYVRAALKTYPEIYFAKLVILGEGPSEEIIIPAIARSQELELDKSFAIVAPIGGRHLSFIWKLLHDLAVPFLTLLDLDVGRIGGGWGRIKYVCEQLLSIGVKPSELLKIEPKEGGATCFTVSELKQLHKRNVNSLDELYPWITHLEEFGVFFSSPLDLDFSMLRSFPLAYKSAAENKPDLPDSHEEKYEMYIQNAITSVVGHANEGGTIYDSLASNEKEFFAWYRYLFLNHSKPATHLQTMLNIDQSVLAENSPEVLKRLVDSILKRVKEG